MVVFHSKSELFRVTCSLTSGLKGSKDSGYMLKNILHTIIVMQMRAEAHVGTQLKCSARRTLET